jgi:hypothetical protein
LLRLPSPRLNFADRLRSDKAPEVLVEALALFHPPPPTYLLGDGPILERCDRADPDPRARRRRASSRMVLMTLPAAPAGAAALAAILGYRRSLEYLAGTPDGTPTLSLSTGTRVVIFDDSPHSESCQIHDGERAGS